ncbi:MAG TPA: substrate-binding domain-containing protein, partial [Stackebrandtia sp.]|uniref:substrate-binding domain-containing protein n=1 Tax=Stackebrandtia sp. TaxID=2023065 RepID=UPI002D36DE13
HLLSQGRHRIATIAGPQDMSVGIDRLDGYRGALRAAGRDDTDSLIAVGDFSEISGARAARALLEREPHVDAIFAASDPMAFGALHALQSLGRKVPEDIAVIGFDDSVMAEHCEPRLTTVRQPVEELGREMARLLHANLHGADPVVTHTILDTELVVRESA